MPTDWPGCLRDPDAVLRWGHHVLRPVDRGFVLRHRRQPWHYLWYLRAGGCRIRTVAGGLDLEAGSLLWLPPLSPHSGRIEAPHTSMTAYSFRFRLLVDGRPCAFAAPILRARAQAVAPLVSLLYEVCCRGEAASDAEALALLYVLYRELVADEAPAAAVAGRFGAHRCQLLAHLVNRRGVHGLAPADLAAELRLSPAHFARVFRRTYGVSPRRWLTLQRLRAAAFDLRHDVRPIAEIAARHGYGDPNLFSRQFRRHLGVSPSAWRRGDCR